MPGIMGLQLSHTRSAGPGAPLRLRTGMHKAVGDSVSERNMMASAVITGGGWPGRDRAAVYMCTTRHAGSGG